MQDECLLTSELILHLRLPTSSNCHTPNSTFLRHVCSVATTFYWPPWNWRRVRCRPRTAAPSRCSSGWWLSRCRRTGGACGKSSSEKGEIVEKDQQLPESRVWRCNRSTTRQTDPRWVTYSSTRAIVVDLREATTVERLLYVLLSRLRFVPSDLQQTVLWWN